MRQLADPGYHHVCLYIRSPKGFCTHVSFELQLLFDVAVTKEFTDDLCSVNMPPLSSIHGRLIIPWEVEKFMENKLSLVSTSYTLALVSYDW